MRVAALLLPAFLICGSCDRPTTGPASRSQPTNSPGNVDALRALPYAGHAEEVAEGESGVDQADEASMSPGLTLVSIAMASTAQLVDEKGALVHEWKHPGHQWSHVTLLPDGDIVTVGADGPAPPGGGVADERRYALRMSWSGDVRWKTHIPARFDIGPAPGENLVVLTFNQQHDSEIHAEIDVRDDRIGLLGPDGETLDSLSILQAIRANSSVFPLLTVKPAKIDGRVVVDLFHANSVEWIDRPALAATSPLYSPDNVLVCFRHQNRVAIFNWKERRVVWAWGDRQLDGPHDAQVLDDGSIVVFDNGLVRGWSRIVELDPLSGEITWEYQRPRKTDFYSRSRGGVQRLSNGNYLITNSDHGEVFEVTRGGRPVWQYFTPLTNSRGQRYTIVRAVRYSRAYVEKAQATNAGGGE